MKITLFTKHNKPTVDKVIEFLMENFEEVKIFQGERTYNFPQEANTCSQDLLISYISPWIIPGGTMDKTKLWNINFHPGPPEYPGIGCTNFAIFNKERKYGITAHLMEEKVDTGKIIAVKRFPIEENESVYNLTQKSYENMLQCFFDVMNHVLKENTLPECNEIWKRKPYTRNELEALCKIEDDMNAEEIESRVKATTYPDMPGAYIEKAGKRFEYKPGR